MKNLEINTATLSHERRFSIFKFLPFILLGAGFIVRLIFAFNGETISENIWSDMQIYVGISNDVGKGVWRTSHFFQSIGYPMLISFLRNNFSNLSVLLCVLQSIASCITLTFMFKTIDEVSGRKTALISLCIASFHYPLILFTNFALPETFFTLLLSVCAYLSWKIISHSKLRLMYSLLWGLSFILAFWLKGTHALWGPLFLVGLYIHLKDKALVPALAICSVVTIGLAAHGTLTYNTIGKVQFSASTSGLNFVEGKCPDKRNTDPLGYSWLSPLYYQLNLRSGKKWDRPFTDSTYYMEQGFQCIKENPFVLVQSLESIPYLFLGNRMWPFSSMPYANYTRIYELFFAVFIIVGLAVYCIDLIRKRVSFTEIFVFVLPVLALFLCVYIFKSEMRYRAPYDVWFIPLGVIGWQRLLHRQNEDDLSLKSEMR